MRFGAIKLDIEGIQETIYVSLRIELTQRSTRRNAAVSRRIFSPAKDAQHSRAFSRPAMNRNDLNEPIAREFLEYLTLSLTDVS